ncbi:MAG: O-antigen ligase domain-containing protein [Sphingomonadales bacterium]|nr:O-antigen ligase domain-containing protein [Sphingomonadales bacterium]
MAASTDHPQILPERLIAATITGSWALWLVGGLYIAGPVLGWTLAVLVVRAWYFGPALPEEETGLAIGFTVKLWPAGMAAMLVILLLGHANFSLGTAQTIKSAVGWAKGWALIALFPLAGAALPIRGEVIYRAVCQLGKQTLILLPLFLAAPFIGLPETLWVSPLKILGGSGDEYFAAVLYTLEPGVGTPRWQFYAPWSPAAGMIAVIHLICALEEKDLRWKLTGIAAGLAVALLSQSRLALVALAVIWPLAWGASRLNRAGTWFAGVPVLVLGSWFAPALIAFAEQAQADFAGARADSTRVRATLGRIAIERWQNEAWWFGHGIVERGPHLVEYMPIGSHHSWYGLLFVKGFAGLLALAVPMGATVLTCISAAMRDRAGRTALAMALVYALYSFGENLEVLTYLCWPALVLIGVGMRKAQR